jgi:hypothetical protein
MPNPENYDNEDDWMSACVPTRIEEGDDQDQAVAVCLSMWRNKKEELFRGAIFKEGQNAPNIPSVDD